MEYIIGAVIVFGVLGAIGAILDDHKPGTWK